MVGALWTGISGLSGSQMGLDNESNNIANVNTIGFKASRVSFADQMYQDKIGKGVTSFDVEKMYTQGNLKITGVSYDMALSGDGFFQLSNGNDTYYSRAGNFRMGESGNLEDVGQNNVQGWAIAEVTADDIISTDPNAAFFTNEFSKLLGNKIIRDTTTIETIATKATDYNTTATSDNKSIYTGAGYKSASTKKSDIEALITQYNAALTVYSEADPKPTSSTSSLQKDLLNFPLSTGTDLAEGDEVYAYIDGVKYSTSFDTDNATTMKNFADVISDTTGFRAYVTDDTSSPYDFDTQAAPEFGYLVVEGLLPGKSYKVSEFGWSDASNSNSASKGTVVNITTATLGTGMGHIESIEAAMAEAISGKQLDVYTPSDLAFSTTPGNNDFTYQIEIYDKATNTNVTVPPTALVLDGVASAGYANTSAGLTALADDINANVDLNQYIKADNINGNLVIRTLDGNNDVEFTGDLQTTVDIQEIQTVTLGGTATATSVSFLGTATTGLTLGDNAATVATAIAGNGGIITAWNLANPTREIATIVAAAGVLTITYAVAEGNVSQINTTTDGGMSFGTSVETETGRALGAMAKSANNSGRAGASAEFLQIKTTINQTSSKGDIQLRLDSLGLTDSAFGDFSVDNTGLITMQQDGVDFAIGQVAVARFTDNRGLEAIGDNLLKSTARSGTAIFNENNDKMAEVKGGQLELSTADLSESLVNLMVFQRAFEANAKSITTADQILTTLIQLKR